MKTYKVKGGEDLQSSVENAIAMSKKHGGESVYFEMSGFPLVVNADSDVEAVCSFWAETTMKQRKAKMEDGELIRWNIESKRMDRITISKSEPEEENRKEKVREIQVKMLAFGIEGEVRTVKIPDGNSLKGKELLAKIFHYGQNDFQEEHHPSVSVGDVALIGECRVLCCRNGWRILTESELKDYEAMPQTVRTFCDLVMNCDPRLET